MLRWYLQLIAGIFCISTSAIFVTLSGVEPTVSAFYRNFFAALIWLLLYPWTRPLDRMPLRSPETAVAAIEDSRRALLFFQSPTAIVPLIVLGAFFAVDLWSWHRCIIFLGAGPATLMGNLQVLIVSLLAVYFFRERLQKWFWPGCLLALAGIGLLTLTKGVAGNMLRGVFYGVLTAITYSSFLIILRFLDRYRVTAQQILFWVAFFSSVFLYLAMAGEGAPVLPGKTALVWLLLHGFLSSVVGWWLIIHAFPHVEVAIASTLLLLQPVLTSIWGHLFLGQTLSPLQVGGIVLALSGIRLATWRGKLKR